MKLLTKAIAISAFAALAACEGSADENLTAAAAEGVQDIGNGLSNAAGDVANTASNAASTAGNEVGGAVNEAATDDPATADNEMTEVNEAANQQ